MIPVLPLLAGVGAALSGSSSAPLLVDLYVDAGANCAAADGTAAHPYCTLTEALAVAVDGDVIRIAPGTYPERVTISDDVDLIGTAGQAATILDGGGNGTVVVVSAGRAVTMDGLTIQNGARRTGGIRNRGRLTLLNSTVKDNRSTTSYYGAGGIEHDSGDSLTLRNCTLSGNQVLGYGYAGGITSSYGGPILIEDCTFAGNAAPSTSAIDVYKTPLTVLRSTFAGNYSPYRGTIHAYKSNFELVNSTIADNDGIGLRTIGTTNYTMTIRSCTISGNGGSVLNGSGYAAGFDSYGPVVPTVTNTIVAGNRGDDVRGAFASAGHNLIGDGTGATGLVDGVNGDQVGTAAAPIDPQLGPLQDNGGPTPTRSPLPGSPAVDAGDQVTFEPTDQRGVPRVAGAVDIGSTESSFGTPIAGCTTNANGSGLPGRLDLIGSNAAAANDLTLVMASVPTNQFGIFITSRATSFVPNPGGSAGNLCLGGQIGRFVGPGQIVSTGAAGSAQLTIDLTQVPQGAGVTSVQAGETWYFQGWFRDVVGGTASSNFTGGRGVVFL